MRALLLIAAAGVVLSAGCEKKKKTAPTNPATGKTDDTTVTPGPGGGVVVGGGGAAGGGGGGAVQAVRGAVQRTVTMNDLNQIRIFIENASLASGRMPSVQETYQALKQEAPNLAKLIDEGTITLHPARTREEVWAYETAALEKGGLMLTSQGVERVDAQTLKQRLGR